MDVMRCVLRGVRVFLLAAACIGLLIACEEEEKKNAPPIGSSSSGGMGDGDQTDTGDGSTDSGGGSTESGCLESCEVVLECDTVYETLGACVDKCETAYESTFPIGAACTQAAAALYHCVGLLDCTDYEAYVDEVPPDAYPCKDEDDTLLTACNP